MSLIGLGTLVKRFLECIAVLSCAVVALSVSPGKAGAQARGTESGQQQTSISILEGPAIQALMRDQFPLQDLRKLITSSRTIHDHPDLPAYYRSKASQTEIRADSYQRFARAFGDRTLRSGDSHFSGGRTAFYFHTAADASLTQARNDRLLAALNEQARQKEGCFSCHSFHGRGGKIAPDLAVEGTRGRSDAWLIAHFKDPQAQFPASVMPSFGTLTNRQLKVLSTFLRYQQ